MTILAASRPVHPRTRGDQPGCDISHDISLGSSPHTRGSDRADVPRQALQRFIPAHAGIRRWVYSARIRVSVHPRTRGDQLFDPETKRGVYGSSPHTRGSDGHGSHPQGRTRFIPAHAGIRRARSRPMTSATVHPRTRGDQIFCQTSAACSVGSSPHTRGSGRTLPEIAGAVRFIPAHAGISLFGTPGFRPDPVHPRTRGDQARWSGVSADPYGSSPHTRGSAPFARDNPRRRRFIPAHAGISC